MKKQVLQALSLFLLLTVFSQLAQAQDLGSEVGYTNIWIDVKAAPQGGGKVFINYQESTLKAWRDAWSFKQAVNVTEYLGTYWTLLYLYAQPTDSKGYSFAGWYKDDGDGVLDTQTDELLSLNEEYAYITTLDDDITLYETQAAAKSGRQPAKADATIFAYFTRGANVSVAFYQDDAPMHANCGTVFISNAINEPGDEVTVRALPNDGFQFEYWADALQMGNPVSRENPYTFTVKGGEKLYAYFTAIDAPQYDFPEEGGYKTILVDKTWVLTDESLKAGAIACVMAPEDLRRTADGKVYLDASLDSARYEVTQWQGAPTILYGKGHVRFAYKMEYGFARSRNPLVKWSGNGITIDSEITYVYAFIDELGAFIEIGNTDTMLNPDATTTVKVPAGLAYMAIPAFDLTDDMGNIPTVIGLSPETFDSGMAGRESALDKLTSISGVRADVRNIQGQKIYTLNGVHIKQTSDKGVYIVNGKKVFIK